MFHNNARRWQIARASTLLSTLAAMLVACGGATSGRNTACDQEREGECDAGADAGISQHTSSRDPDIDPNAADASIPLDGGDAPPQEAADAGTLIDGDTSDSGASDSGTTELVECVTDAECDNGQFCDGQESCEDGRCVMTDPVVPADDGVECTRAVCDESEDVWRTLPDDAACEALNEPPACDENGLLVQVKGLCDAERGCEAERQALEACPGEDPASCEDGKLTVLRRICAPDEGCELSELQSTCPSGADRCDDDGNHLSFAPSCSDETRCDPEGQATKTECTASADQCARGRLTTYASTCDSVGGCGEEANTESCPAADPYCNADGDLVTSTPSCADDGSCDPDGAESVSACEASPPSCSSGQLTTFAATCDPDMGCGEQAETRACPAADPYCNAAGDHVVATAACADAVSCREGGRQATTECTAPGDECSDGQLQTYSATCDASSGCGVQSDPTSSCPAHAAECDGSRAHITYTPACSSGSACDDRGAAQEELCEASADQCSGGVLTQFDPTCDPAEGCGQSSSEKDCSVAPPTCNSDGDFVTYSPACQDSSSCHAQGKSSVTSCKDRCTSGVLYAATCSGSGCGEAAGSSCPKPAAKCSTNTMREPVYTTYRSVCESSEACDPDGAVANTEVCGQSYSCSNDNWVRYGARCGSTGCERGSVLSRGSCASQESRSCLDFTTLRVKECECSGSTTSACKCTTKDQTCELGYCRDGVCIIIE